jgi:hypothetical protein
VDDGRGLLVGCDGGPVDVEEVTRVELREVLLDVLRWCAAFLRSPGLGGLAAVGAAWVGLQQWRRQGTAHEQARRDEQWWEVYRLAHAARSTAPGDPAPQDQRLLWTLARGAETEVQMEAARALLAAYAPEADQDDDEGMDR